MRGVQCLMGSPPPPPPSCLKAKYEYAEGHTGVKVVSPDWILDSVEANTRFEESGYHPSRLKKGGEHSIAATATTAAENSCNGVMLSESMSTTAVAQQPVAQQPVAAVGGPIIPAKVEHQPKNGATPPEGMSVVSSATVQQVLSPVENMLHDTTATTTTTTTTVALIAADVQGNDSERRNNGKAEETLGRMPSTAQTTPSTAQATPSTAQATPTSDGEKLLEGVVVYFTDYQDCVEPETLDKWKLVGFEPQLFL